jgi:hypothetical protein
MEGEKAWLERLCGAQNKKCKSKQHIADKGWAL